MLETRRKEEKYLISVDEFGRLRQKLAHYIRLDQHGLEKGYLVRSLYFDSINDQDLCAVLDGVETKSKIRLRVYGTEVPDRFVKLEYKQKVGVDIHKRTLNLAKNQAESLARGEYRWLLAQGSALAVRLYAKMTTEVYRPSVLIAYQRLAYHYVPGNIRITFDTNVNASMIVSTFFTNQLPKHPVLPPDIGVLEVKHNGFLNNLIREALNDLDVQLVSNSKYAKARLATQL